MIFKNFATRLLIPFTAYMKSTNQTLKDSGSIQHPIRWDRLRFYFSQQCLGGTLRSAENREHYLRFKAYIKENNLTMEQYISNRILGFKGHPERPINYLRQVQIEGSIADLYLAGEKQDLDELLLDTAILQRRIGLMPGSNFILMTRNNFPYDLQVGVEHWVVWSKGSYKDQSISRVLYEVLLEGYELQVYQNDHKNKSVPEISHKQLFLRRKAK